MKLFPTRIEFAATVIAFASTTAAMASTAFAQHSPAPAAASAAPTSTAVDIEPGVRFGALRLGMSRAQVIAAMPGVPLRPDTREFDRTDHSTGAFIGPYEIVFAASGELRSVTAGLAELRGGVRIDGHVLASTSAPAAVIAALHGCGTRQQVGGGFITRCTGIDVEDMSGAAGLRLAVHR